MPEGISPAKGIECELYAQAWHLTLTTFTWKMSRGTSCSGMECDLASDSVHLQHQHLLPLGLPLLALERLCGPGEKR